MIRRVFRDQSAQTEVKCGDIQHLESLSVELCKLLESGSYSDVVIKTSDKSFPAHRALLASRSDVFDALFRSNMKESKEGVIDINDIESSDIKQFLTYIYSGKLDDISNDTAKRLYKIADKYAVEFLRMKCSSFLVENLTKANALGVLALADEHSDSSLMASVVEYVVQTEDIMDGEIWQSFCDAYPKPALETYKSYRAKLKLQKWTENKTKKRKIL